MAAVFVVELSNNASTKEGPSPKRTAVATSIVDSTKNLIFRSNFVRNNQINLIMIIYVILELGGGA